MKRINLEYLILEVLENEIENDNEFLSAGEIAYRCGGLLYTKGKRRRAPITTVMVKTRMSSVKQRALETGFVVTSIRMKHTKNGGKSLKVLGWKIADDNDKRYVIADIEINQFMRNGHGDSIQRVSGIAKKKGILSPNDIPQLTE